ncbi:Phosphatidylinositide phosphatase SAC1 [Clydaea vesicula]|uniref:Phosphatidylinositide phosphatase SAC1 n=1 Tax=Clydaea vesicula TaxID=447962 RepID=A0AAD5U3P8_9FUNG|nr:Phosphatidylinositide phosphatase SAC1 [Clydaea vesicula]
MVHETLRLYVSSETFTLEPAYADPNVIHETIVINRENGGLKRNAPPSSTLAQEEVLTTFGLMGIIKLNAGDHIIVITDRKKVGNFAGNDVYRITGTKVIPVPKSRLHLSERQVQDDDRYLSLLEDMLSKDYFYVSYTMDLTNTLQRTFSPQDVNAGKRHWERADDRFFWNKNLQIKLIDITTHNKDQDMSNFILPVICGFVSIKQIILNNKRFTFSIVTRRSRFRAGTRFNVRGIDDAGNVANFVETEQLVYFPEKNQKVSYLQTRGSMPLYWRQIPNIRYTPRLEIDLNPNSATSFRKHFAEQITHYGNQIVVNLINKKGYEMGLGDEFQKHILTMNDARVKYIHFDFHQQCKNMRWDRISLLLDEIGPDLEAQGYCHVNENNLLVRVQNSVVRTNCMDCLDRTNVVQSVLARIFLTKQLRDLQILSANESVEDTGDSLENIFKHVWADNADAVSHQYSGTGALKTDYTRFVDRPKLVLNLNKSFVVLPTFQGVNKRGDEDEVKVLSPVAVVSNNTELGNGNSVGIRLSRNNLNNSVN